MKIEVINDKKKIYNSENINTRNNPELLESNSNQEINFDYSQSDKEIILKSKIEVKKNLSDYYREFTYLDDNKDVIRRYAIFNKEREEISSKTLLKGRMGFLSNKGLKVKNIKTKTSEELIEHFCNIIDNMKKNESFKDVLKDFFKGNVKTFKTHLPILYFDDELNKNVWVIPNFNGSEDVVLDYDSEIPIFRLGFENSLYKKNFNLNYFLINKKGIEIFSTGMDSYSGNIKNLKIKDIEIDDTKLYFSTIKTNKTYSHFSMNLSTEDLYLHSDNELTSDYFKVSDDKRFKFSIPYPHMAFLDEEKTIEILKMTNSPKTIEDIKNNIKIYTKSLEFSDDKLDKYSGVLEHNLFVSTNFNRKLFNFSDENILNDLCIKDKSINIFKMKMEDDFIKESTKLTNVKGDNYYVIKDKSGYEKLLPHDIKENQNYQVLDNFNSMFENNDYTESTYVKLKVSDLTEKSIFDLKESSKLKSDMLTVEKHQSLIHTENNKLFLIDTINHSLDLIDTTKKIDLFDKKMIKLLNLNNDNVNLTILKTDNNIIYFPMIKKEKYKTFSELEKIKNNFIKIEKNLDGNFIFKTVLPLTNNARRLKYEIGDEKINYKNENGELKLDLENESSNVEMFLDYELKDNFFELLQENIKSEDKKNQNSWSSVKSSNIIDINFYYENGLKTNNPESLSKISFFDKSLVGIKINKDININKEYSLMFLNKLQMKEEIKDTTFNMKIDDNNMIIDVIDRKSKFSKYLLVHNFKNDYNVSFYANNDVNSNELFNQIKTNKILSKIDNAELKKDVLFSKDKMYILDKFSSTMIVDIDYKKTKEIENSIVNHKKSLSFSNKNGNFDIVLDSNKKIKSFEDTEKKKKMFEQISSYGIL